MDVESRSDCPSARSGKPARLPGRLRASAPSGRLCASVRAAPLRDSTERFCAPIRMFRASARFFLSGSPGPRAAARLLLQFSTARCAPVRFLRVTAECAPPRPSDRFRPSASARASARFHALRHACACVRFDAPLQVYLCATARASARLFASPLRADARFDMPPPAWRALRAPTSGPCAFERPRSVRIPVRPRASERPCALQRRRAPPGAPLREDGIALGLPSGRASAQLRADCPPGRTSAKSPPNGPCGRASTGLRLNCPCGLALK